MTGSLALALLLSGGPREPAVGLRWEHSFDDALKKAQATRKPLLVDFWASWCSWCRRLDRTTYVDYAVVALGQEFVAAKVNTEGNERERAVTRRYEVSTLPSIVFLSPSGRVVQRVSGYQGPGQFPSTMQHARKEAVRVMEWEARLEQNPRDALPLLQLGLQQFHQEAYRESRDLLERALEVEAALPRQERKHARLLLAVILKSYDQDFARAEGLLKEALAIRPADDYDPKLLYVLSRTYMAAGRHDEARDALQEILEAHADSPVAQKARETLAALDRNNR